MTLWLRTYALFCPPSTDAIDGVAPAPMPAFVAVCTNDADGTLNFGDDNTGLVVSMQPGGAIDSRPNGTKGAWEVKSAGPANLFAYTVNGVTHLVPYRQR